MLWPTLHLRIARRRPRREGQKGTKAASEVTKAADQAVENATKSKAPFIPAHVMLDHVFYSRPKPAHPGRPCHGAALKKGWSALADHLLER
jgi:hypothetical protein